MDPADVVRLEYTYSQVNPFSMSRFCFHYKVASLEPADPANQQQSVEWMVERGCLLGTKYKTRNIHIINDTLK